MRAGITTLLIPLLIASLPASGAEDPITDGVVQAAGLGTVDTARFSNPIQAKLLAKRAAVVDAQRNLLEMIEGVRVTSGTTVKDAQLESDVVANRVKGLLKGAFTVSEEVTEMEGAWLAEVTLAVCVNARLAECEARPKLAAIVYDSLEKSDPGERFIPAQPDPDNASEISGLIVDLTSQPNFSPRFDVRLVTPEGKEVYGPGHFDPASGEDWIHWTRSIDEARQKTGVIGSSPMVLAAAGTTDDANVIVATDDAVSLFNANGKNAFLKAGKVIFVIN